jgi:hypothetical protein
MALASSLLLEIQKYEEFSTENRQSRLESLYQLYLNHTQLPVLL